MYSHGFRSRVPRAAPSLWRIPASTTPLHGTETGACRQRLCCLVGEKAAHPGLMPASGTQL